MKFVKCCFFFLLLCAPILHLELDAKDDDKKEFEDRFAAKHAEEKKMQLERFNGDLMGIAEGKKCERDLILPLLISASGVVGLGMSSVIASNIAVAWPGPIKIAVAVGLGTAAVASSVYFMTTSIQLITCILTTVRDPVMVFDYKTLNNPNDPRKQHVDAGRYYKVVKTDANGNIKIDGSDKYEDATKAWGSNYMTVCTRQGMTNAFESQASKSDDVKNAYYDQWLLKEELRYAESLNFNISETARLKDFYAVSNAKKNEMECTYKPLYKGDETVLKGLAKIKIIESGAKICAKLIGNGVTNWLHQPILGCHKNNRDAPAPMCAESIPLNDDSKKEAGHNLFKMDYEHPNPVSYDNSQCFSCEMAKSCFDSSFQFSQSPLPISSSIVQCFFDSVDMALTGKNMADKDLNCKEESMLYIFQKNISQTIQAFLVIVLMFTALKAMISGGQMKVKEYIVFFLKLSLVFYFVSPDGGMRHYYMELRKLNSALMDITFSASKAKGLCEYPNDSYVQNIDVFKYDPDTRATKTIQDKRNYSFLRIWDMIDCKLLSYLHIGLIFGNEPLSTEELKQKAKLVSKNSKVIKNVGAYIASEAQIVIGILMFFVIVLIFSVLVWVTIMYIFSFTAIALLIFTSPLFIPMILLQNTKPFFEGWLNAIIGYSVFPIAIIGFVAFFFVMTDDFYFGNAEFTSRNYIDDAGIKKRIFSVHPRPEDQNKLAFVLHGIKVKAKPYPFGYKTVVDESSSGKNGPLDRDQLYGDLLIFIIFLIFYVMFLNIANGIAAELSGGARPMLEFAKSVPSPAGIAKSGVQAGYRAAVSAGQGIAAAGAGIKNKITGGGGDKGETSRDKGAGSSNLSAGD